MTSLFDTMEETRERQRKEVSYIYTGRRAIGKKCNNDVHSFKSDLEQTLREARMFCLEFVKQTLSKD